jgi:hypothetical protein
VLRDEPQLHDADGDPDPSDRLHRRVRHVFHRDLSDVQQSALLAWLSFGTTFGLTRGLTTWIRHGHGPAGGGLRLGGQHFHHYNLGIGILAGIGAVAIRGSELHRKHPVTAISYGASTALIVDEAALLLDLQDVYWTPAGEESVNLAIGIIAGGGALLAGAPFWPAFSREVFRTRP